MVPNKFPSASAAYRIALIGEAPGKDEEEQGQPFVGYSGRLLTRKLSAVGILREAVFIGNVCQYRPEYNNIATFDWDGDEIQSGLEQLTNDLLKFRPNLIVCLGATAFHAFKEGNSTCKKYMSKDGLRFKFPNSIDSWRGSIFNSHISSPFPNTKCLATYHPAACLRMYEWLPILELDLRKSVHEGKFAGIVTKQRNRWIPETDSAENLQQLLYYINNITGVCSFDIEGGLLNPWGGIKCLSVATSDTESFLIPFVKMDNSPFWTDPEMEVSVWRATANLLWNQNIKKVWQNGLYDRFVFQYGFNCPVLGNADDTMLKFWEYQCELPIGLDFQTSVFTDVAYYKANRKSNDRQTFFEYCCTDSLVTKEINTRLDKILIPESKKHYEFNHALLNNFLYMELRGISYDSAAAKTRLKAVNSATYRLQAKLDKIACCGIDSTLPRELLLAKVREIMCYKRDTSKPKAEYAADYDRVIRILLGEANLTQEEVGFINTATGLTMNIKSKQFKSFLYDILGLPKQYSKTTGSETTNYDALLKLSKKSPHPAVALALDIGVLRTRSQMLSISADPDSRVRCGYNIVGTVTGRISCYTSPTGSGYNLQTIPDTNHLLPPENPLHEGMRSLFRADTGHWFGQCDLKGSDGWTIGAYLASLGAPQMLEDLRYGIKPASRICYLLRHGITSLTRVGLEETKTALKEVKKEDWDYFGCKVGIWGICYLMGPDLLSDSIAEASEGKVTLSRTQVQSFHHAVMQTYSVKLLHDYMKRQLATRPELVSPSGHKRRFFGREAEILGQALAHLPQSVTTYATNLAAYRLWTDPENRTQGGIPFRVEPLHQVHDALCVQWKKEDTTWAIGKIKQWFDNPLTIAGQKITIPFEGAYGPSWGEQNVGKII